MRQLTIRDTVGYFHITNTAKNLSPLTQRYYAGQLAHLVAAFGDAPPDALTLHDLRALVTRLRTERAWSVTQANHFIGSLKTFYSYLLDEGLIAVNPADRLVKLRAATRLPDVLTYGDIKALMAVIPATFIGQRNRAMLAMLLDCGLRLHELMALNLADVDMQRLTLTVMGKGAKERLVPFSPVLARVLAKYLPQRARRAKPYIDALWVSDEGTALNYYYLHGALRGYATAAKLTRAVHPHLFRHTFATEYLRNGGSPYVLQQILGHTSPQMTAHYVHLSSADAVNEHRIASPLAKWRTIIR